MHQLIWITHAGISTKQSPMFCPVSQQWSQVHFSPGHWKHHQVWQDDGKQTLTIDMIVSVICFWTPRCKYGRVLSYVQWLNWIAQACVPSSLCHYSFYVIIRIVFSGLDGEVSHRDRVRLRHTILKGYICRIYPNTRGLNYDITQNCFINGKTNGATYPLLWWMSFIRIC